MPTDTPQLDDRYTVEEGRVFLGGVQALVRLPLDAARRDRRAGLRTGTFVTGYPGSPLGSYDLALAGARPLLEEHGVVHRPALNEELGATALRGTQLLDRYPHGRYDGVTGLWYGKGPGMDRSGDALRHGNYQGTSEHGAVVVLSGEDHEAKSSSLPYEQEYAFVHAGMPVLYPASVAEFLELGLHAIALSRFSGCWVGMKLVGQLCDGGQTIDLRPGAPAITLPEVEVGGRPFRKWQDAMLFPGQTIETERALFDERHAAALAYARANALSRATHRGQHDRLAIVTAGKSYLDTLQALRDLGLDDGALRTLGIRLVKLGLLYPFDAELLREQARGVEEVVVVEEKRGFVEERVRDVLYGQTDRPRVVGKRDEHGEELFGDYGVLDSDAIAERLGPRLAARHAAARPAIERRLHELEAIRRREGPAPLRRIPNYCSGCPHNVSTRLLEGQVAWGSPGCHIFAAIMDQPHRQVDATFQLGGEGAGWIGLEPFTDLEHLVQNQGDGSLFHSSYLNIRFAVAAGAHMTFKILFNGSVANTGAQPPVGAKRVPDLCRLLALEGVTRIAVIAKEPREYRRAGLPSGTTVHGAADAERVLAELARTQGVTVYLYDGECANERRRRQKRGTAPAPTRFVVINEDVCENCGHCGELTNCMSLQKVETEFGPKTAVHQSSCNQDHSCLGGDCPSFVTVETPRGRRPTAPPSLEAADIPPPPTREATEPFHVYVPGVGGTGVLTVNALLAWAALIDGRDVTTYDQTGAAQKWGAVLSSIVLRAPGQEVLSNRVGLGRADLYLALDAVAAADAANLARCSPGHTVAVLSTDPLPTGEMIRNVHLDGQTRRLIERIDRSTDSARNVRVDARSIAEGLFGDYLAANVIALGAAYQAGLLPLSGEAIEGAIELNGAAVAQNLQAFRYGRLTYHDPDRVRALALPPRPELVRPPLTGRDRAEHDRLLEGFADLDGEGRRLLSVRVAELIRYQDAGYARAYAGFVRRVADRERERVPRPGEHSLTREVIRGLHRLMAYKDEYEVARLHLEASVRERARTTFAGRPRLTYHLHPPLLRALGVRRKVRVGEWFDAAFWALHRLRRLRGTALDPFGHTRVRREERRLVGWYRELVERALHRLSADTHETAVQIAALPDLIRGYESIKLRGIAEAERQATLLLERLEAGVDDRDRVPHE